MWIRGAAFGRATVGRGVCERGPLAPEAKTWAAGSMSDEWLRGWGRGALRCGAVRFGARGGLLLLLLLLPDWYRSVLPSGTISTTALRGVGPRPRGHTTQSCQGDRAHVWRIVFDANGALSGTCSHASAAGGQARPQAAGRSPSLHGHGHSHVAASGRLRPQ